MRNAHSFSACLAEGANLACRAVRMAPCPSVQIIRVEEEVSEAILPNHTFFFDNGTYTLFLHKRRGRAEDGLANRQI